MVGYQKVTPDSGKLVTEQVNDDYIVLTQRPAYQSEAGWKNEAERKSYVQKNKLRFLRPYQLRAIRQLQTAVKEGTHGKYLPPDLWSLPVGVRCLPVAVRQLLAGWRSRALPCGVPRDFFPYPANHGVNPRGSRRP